VLRFLRTPFRVLEKDMAFRSSFARKVHPAARSTETGDGPVPASAELHGHKAPAAHGLDIAGRLKLLKDTFEKNTWSDDRQGHPALAWVPDAKRLARKNRTKLTKLLIGLVIIAAVGYLPVRALLQTTSTEAILNARLITLRAPIEGEVGTGLNGLVVGTQLDQGAPLVKIDNMRADRGRLDDLRRLIGQLEGERAAFVTRNQNLSALHGELADQTQSFKEARERQLDARIAELRSEIAGATANKAEAERALARATPLAESGTISTAGFEKVKRDVTVTTETETALRHRLAGVEVERAALARGVFVGDSYNDQPRSSQRADEIAQRLSEVAADIRERDVRLAALRTELADETRRYEALARADLTAPVRGSVWEVLTAPGETVVRGQELVRLLDCSGLVVTATVGETAYNRLKIGDPARFRLRGESADHKGRIIGLTGVAAAPANLAIQPAALAKEPYRVTVLLPDMARGGQCDVGRTGRVTFE
jgi:multidrug resistance efflux pump